MYVLLGQCVNVYIYIYIYTDGDIITIYILLIGWPSVASKYDDFVQLAKNHTFFASEHHQCNVIVKGETEIDKLKAFPLPKTCDSCRRRFSESGIMASVGGVDWEHVASSMFDPSTLVSLYFIQKAPCSILPLFI